MSKQTALDWYWDKIKSQFEHDGDLLETAIFTFAIAKQKEREQIIDAHKQGEEFALVMNMPDSKEYYDMTYKGGEE